MCNNWTLPSVGGVATVGGDRTLLQFIITKKYMKVSRIGKLLEYLHKIMCNNWTLPSVGGVVTMVGDRTLNQFIFIKKYFLSRDGAC